MVRYKAGLALTAASLLVLTACGGEQSEASADGDDPIKIMTIAPVETTIQNYPDAEAGARAAVEAINADGGIDGRMLDWEFCNTESDPNVSASCAREADSSGAVAVVGQVDAYSTTSLPLLEQAGIPSLGQHTVFNEVDWDSPVAYPFHGGPPVAHLGALEAIKQEGGSRIQIVAIDVAASTTQIALQEQAIELAGLEHAGTMTIPVSGVSDYAPYAQQIADNNADGVIFTSSADVASAMIEASHSLGIYPTFGYNVFSFGEDQVAALGEDAENVIVGSPYPSFRETDIPAIQQFNEELDAAGVPAEDVSLRSQVGFNAWLAVHTFADIAETIEDEITRENFKEKLDATGEMDLMGVMDWNPSELGSETNPDFPRIPPTSVHFLSLNDEGQLVTREDLDSVDNVLEGITP